MAQQKSQKQTQKGKGKQEKSFFFSLTSRVCILLAAALMALSYLSFVVNPAKLWVLSLFGIGGGIIHNEVIRLCGHGGL